MNIQITTTPFDHNYYGSKIVGSNTYGCGLYRLHQIDIFNEIQINGEKYQAVYQCGNRFMYGDYSCPDPDLSLSDDVGGSGTSGLIYGIWTMGEEEIKELKGDELEEFCESLSDYAEYTVYSVEELIKIYKVIKENDIAAQRYMDSLELTDAEEEAEEA